ncbi:hypothetical protein [Pseudoalteromonas sp. MMG007]
MNYLGAEFGSLSLSTLASLPIDVIKIDHSFIVQANKSQKYNDILDTTH